MELNDYQVGAMSTRMETCDNYVYMAEGLVGEVGELFSKIAKGVRKEEIIVNQNFLFFPQWQDWKGLYDGVKGELGDILWFVAGLAELFGFTLEEVAQYNLAKLASRKERNVIVGDGDNR